MGKKASKAAELDDLIASLRKAQKRIDDFSVAAPRTRGEKITEICRDAADSIEDAIADLCEIDRADLDEG